MRIALLGLRLGEDAIHDRHQHIFVMATVEDDDLAADGYPLMDAPQVVASAGFVVRRLPSNDLYTQRTHLAEHATDGAVFAAGVGALQNDEQPEPAIGVEEILKPVEVFGQLDHPSLVLVLVATRKGLLRRIESRQIEAQGLCCQSAAVLEGGDGWSACQSILLQVAARKTAPSGWPPLARKLTYTSIAAVYRAFSACPNIDSISVPLSPCTVQPGKDLTKAMPCASHRPSDPWEMTRCTINDEEPSAAQQALPRTFDLLDTRLLRSP